MKKRIPALLLAMLLAASLLAGCTDSGSGTSGTSAAKNTAPAASSAPVSSAPEAKPNFNPTGYPIVNEPVSYTTIVNQNPLHGEDRSQMELYAYMEEATNVKIKYDPIPNSDWETKLNLTLASGDIPDFIYSGIGKTNVQKYGVEGGMFLDYSGLIETYMPNLITLQNEIPDVLSHVRMINGGIYNLPYVPKTATVPGYTLYYREDMLRAINQTNPGTIEEFYDTLIALKAHYGADFVPVLPNNIDTLLWCIFPSFGDAWSVGFGDQGDGVVTFNLMGEQYRRTLEFMHKLYSEGLLENEIFTMDATARNGKIKDGKVAFMNAGTQLTPEYFESGKIEVKLNPPMLSEWTSERKISDSAIVFQSGMTINAKLENPEILLRWADIFFDNNETIPGLKGGMSMWLGIRGENWDYSEDGKNYYRIVPEDTKLSEEEYKLKYVSTGEGWGFIDGMLLPVNNPTQEMKASECLANYFPYAKANFPDTSLVYEDAKASRLASLWTDLSTYINNSRDGFVSGTLSLDKWDEYVATLNKMGIEEVLQLKQEAYDRFLSAAN